jgi:hypothetical protein
MPARPVPDAYRNAIPYIIVNGASRAIDFYKVRVARVHPPDGGDDSSWFQ